MKKTLLLIISLLIVNAGLACTTAIISGKHTADGRPMIWKLRDSDYFKNKMIYFDDGKYDYIGVVNSEDLKGEQVWGGANAKGFSIMNSASFNVNIGDTSLIKDLEGYIMKRALQECVTLEDFEQLLNSLPKPMGLAAHFGVIDAKGGAAFYEVNNYTFTKFDANNPVDAPNGYIIRTNFSFTGKKDVGYGFIRFQTAQEIFYQAESMGKLNYQTIIQDFSRCFKHSLLDKDYKADYLKIPEGEHFINSDDFITRFGSASALLIHGVKPDESADLTTVWSIIGFPNTCIAVPMWVKGGKNLPKMMVEDKTGNAPLNEIALELKDQCYPIKRESGYKYLQISKLVNSDKTGFVQKIEIAEKTIFIKTEENLNKWRKGNANEKEIASFYNWLDDFVAKTYLDQLGMEYKN